MENTIIDEFKLLLKDNLKEVNGIITLAEELGVTNEQFYIDYEIELSHLATADHNKPS